MKTLTQFRTDQPLTEQQYKYFDEVIKKAPRRVIVGRKLLDLTPPYGFGKQAITFNVLTEVQAGKINLAWGVDFTEDIPNLTPTTLPIPVLHKEWKINRRSFEASRTHGEPLDTAALASAAYKCGILEDELIIKGYSKDGTTYDIKGLYESAGNDEDTALDWGTKANILTSINNAVTLLTADNIFPPFNLTLNPIQFNQLFQHVANTARFYRDVVKERIGGEIYQTPALVDGKGMLTAAPGAGFFDLAVGVDMTHEETILEKTKDLWGVVYECICPRVWETNAVCKLSAI